MSTPAASPVRWRDVVDSSCIARVGWDSTGGYVKFHRRGGELHRFAGCSRQRIIALVRSTSPGEYFNSEIAPRYPCWLIAGREED